MLTGRRAGLPRAARAGAAMALLIALASGGTQNSADAASGGVQTAAAAPGTAAKPVSGGGGFGDAPLLAAGIHTDTLLPRETLFYAVALRAGQRLRVHATIDISVGSRGVQDIPDALGGFPVLALFTPLRQRLPNDHGPDDADLESETQSAEAVSPRVLSAAAAGRAAARNEDWTGPGVYHVVVVLSEVTRDLGATVEFPLRLAIEIDGSSGPSGPATATASASQGPLGDPRAGPTADRRAGARSDGGGTASFDTGLVVGGAAAALLLGASAGYLGAARRSRSYRP